MTVPHIAPVIPASAVPAARRAGQVRANRPLPLARPVRAVPRDVVYGLALIDASGRICERAILTALGWQGGDRLTLTAGAGVVTARRDPGGMATLPPSAYITIPAAPQQAAVDAALVVLKSMGLTLEDLAAYGQRPDVPTFAYYVPVVSATVTEQ